MSWGYWGIVTGLVALVVTLLISIDLFYRPPKNPGEEEKKTRSRRGELDPTTHKQRDVA